MSANNRLLYTSGVFKKIVVVIVAALLGLLVYAALTAGTQRITDSQNNSNIDTKKYTPMPARVSVPVPTIPPTPDGYTQVQEAAPFVPFSLPKEFSLVPENETPDAFLSQYTKYYRREGVESSDWLRVTIEPNSLYESINAVVDKLTTGVTVYDKRVYKRNGNYAMDVLFTSNANKFLSEYSVVYVPGFYHIIGYSVERKPNVPLETDQQKVADFVKEFLNYYDLSLMTTAVPYNTDPREQDVLFQNEKYFQANSKK